MYTKEKASQVLKDRLIDVIKIFVSQKTRKVEFNTIL